MTNHSKTFYQLADEFGAWMGEKPIERISYVPRPRSIDMSQFTEEQIAWIKEAEENER